MARSAHTRLDDVQTHFIVINLNLVYGFLDPDFVSGLIKFFVDLLLLKIVQLQKFGWDFSIMAEL